MGPCTNLCTTCTENEREVRAPEMLNSVRTPYFDCLANGGGEGGGGQG